MEYRLWYISKVGFSHIHKKTIRHFLLINHKRRTYSISPTRMLNSTNKKKHKEDLMNFSTSVLDTIITSSGFSFLQKGRSTPEISSKLFARYILKIVMQSENLFNWVGRKNCSSVLSIGSAVEGQYFYYKDQSVWMVHGVTAAVYFKNHTIT